MIFIHDPPTSFPNNDTATLATAAPIITTVNLTKQIPAGRRNRSTAHLPSLHISHTCPHPYPTQLRSAVSKGSRHSVLLPTHQCSLKSLFSSRISKVQLEILLLLVPGVKHAIPTWNLGRESSVSKARLMTPSPLVISSRNEWVGKDSAPHKSTR